MKKLLTAIVFSAMTLTGMGGGAAEAAPAPAAKPVVTIKAKTDTSAVKPKDDNTVIEAKKAAEASLVAKQVQPQVALPDTLYPRTKGDDYFKDAKLKNNITYAPLSNLTKEDIFYSGVVNVKKKDITAAAFVTGAQYEGDLADEQYSKFFVKGNLSQDAIRQLYTYNVALLRLEYGLNDVFLKTASAVKLEGEEIPYGILSVRIPKVEQIHKLKGYENIYTASINPVFVADNYLIPLHIRAFAAHVDGKYRNLLIIGPASETDIFDQAGLDIILSKPKDEKK